MSKLNDSYNAFKIFYHVRKAIHAATRYNQPFASESLPKIPDNKRELKVLMVAVV